MKIRKLLIASILVLFTLIPVFATRNISSANNKTPVSATNPEVRSGELLKRLEEIRAMDIKSMSKAEKKELRKEVRSIEKEIRQINNGGVYISVGGIIIILLLLILLL